VGLFVMVMVKNSQGRRECGEDREGKKERRERNEGRGEQAAKRGDRRKSSANKSTKRRGEGHGTQQLTPKRNLEFHWTLGNDQRGEDGKGASGIRKGNHKGNKPNKEKLGGRAKCSNEEVNVISRIEGKLQIHTKTISVHVRGKRP